MMVSKLGVKRKKELKEQLANLAYLLKYELPTDPYFQTTYHMCGCGREATRKGVCWMCLVEEIANIANILPKRKGEENGIESQEA